MIAQELIRQVEAVGGSLSLQGNRIHYQLPAGAVAVLDELRAHREEVLAELRRRHWRPGDEIIDKVPELEPTKPTKPIEGTRGSAHGESGLPNQCPPLPRGVRLVRYEPKSPPVGIDVATIVVDVEKFILVELRELNARLHSPQCIRGGWGVFAILDRLRQVGLELALEATLEKAKPASADAPKGSQGDFRTPTGDGGPQ